MKTTLCSILITAAFCVFANSCASVQQSGVSPVFISEEALPTAISAERLGRVTASDSWGYRRCASLHGALANEARNLGANAVFFTYGDRRVTATSWSAPTVSGQAYHVRNLQSLAGIKGQFFGSSKHGEGTSNR